MGKKWMPEVVGITNIIFCGFVGLFMLLMWGLYFNGEGSITVEWTLQLVVLSILTILGFVGGVYARWRRKWKLALAGSISVLLLVVSCGIFSLLDVYPPQISGTSIIMAFVVIVLLTVPIALIAMSKNEFK
jgi:hypothetical protein